MVKQAFFHIFIMKYISILLYFFIFAGGVVTAFLSQTFILKVVGTFISICTLISGILTYRDIEKLKEKAKNAIYFKEI